MKALAKRCLDWFQYDRPLWSVLPKIRCGPNLQFLSKCYQRTYLCSFRFDISMRHWQTNAMRTVGKYFLRLQAIKRSSSLSLLIVYCGTFLTATLSATPVQQKQHEKPFGIAWRVEGRWRAETQGRIIVNGDAILPGTLVHPVEAGGRHSILILLPDGQRILYECFLAEDCAHSFRVPQLYRTPEPAAVDLIARIHQVLSRREQDQNSGEHRELSLPGDEVLAVLGPSNQVVAGGLAAALPNGEYTYSLRPLNRKFSPQSGMTLKKMSHAITLPLPASGLYDITIFDHLGTPRIDLFVAAVDPSRELVFKKSFAEAHALLADWNEGYQGWPIHDFQRAYLKVLFWDIKPASEYSWQAATATHQDADITAEPAFSSAPGLLTGDTAVTLACRTPHATMHYTVNGSQPLKSSPIYNAPVMVKGTALTIKAFASAPGKNDSPVVTGIFRIAE